MVDNQDLQIVNHWRIPTWFPDLSPETNGRLRNFFDELVKFNRTVNLVLPKTIPTADLVHFSDSILAARVIMGSYSKLDEIYDLGSGAGFPGLVFAILYPNVKVHLVEPDLKRCEFLRHIINITNTKNAEVLCQKIEDLKENSILYAIARGFASITKTILPLRKAMRKGGALFHLKGDEWAMEISSIPIQLCSLWSPGLVGEYRLPAGELKLSVIKTDKIG